MKVSPGSTFKSAVALATLALTAACGSPSKVDATVPFPAEDGIQQGLSLASLQAAGWQTCHEDAYGDLGPAVATVVAGCSGRFMMLACRPDGATDTLTLAAADARSVVTQEDAAGLTTHHVAHGVGWYRTDSMSWGFFPATEAVNRDSCDMDPDGTQTLRQQRLCWHANAGALAKGYRCGDNELNDSTDWRRLVLVYP